MALSIRNRKAEELARRVAAESGESLTETIIHALEERLEKIEGKRAYGGLGEELTRIAERCARLPDNDPRSAEEILGYDDAGTHRPW